MLNDLYCSLRDNIAKLFASSAHTTVSFADELYRASAACANIVIRDNSDVSEDCRIGLTMAFLHGILHLTDRYAFSVIPARRSEVMDHLLSLCYGQVINAFSGPNITVAEKQKLLGTALGKYNEVTSFYQTCKKMSPQGEESPKGTFFWEFGKQFASAANHAKDVAFVAFGSRLLLDVCKHLQLPEKLSAL